MPTNFCPANVVNVFLKKQKAAKTCEKANAHRSNFNDWLGILGLDFFDFIVLISFLNAAFSKTTIFVA
jgi:hypothetical protein